MEHREPPRIAAGDRRSGGAVENASGRFRLRAFDPFRSRARPWSGPAGRGNSGGCCASPQCSSTADLERRAARLAGFIASRSINLRSKISSWFARFRGGIAGGKREFLSRVRRSSGNPTTSLNWRFGPIGWRWHSSSTRGSRK